MGNPPSGFEQLVESYYRDWWRLSPSSGSRAGLYEFDAQLEVPGKGWIEARRQLLVRTVAELGRLEVPQRGTVAALDRRTFESNLANAQLRIDQLQHWRQDTSGPVTEAVDAVFELVMRRDLGGDTAAHAVISRLEMFPEYLRAARERIDDPVAMWNSIAGQVVPGGIEFVRDAARELSARHPRKSPQIESVSAAACTALQEYGQWVQSLESANLRDDVAAGPAVLQRLIREWHGIDSTAEEIETLGWSLVQFFGDELDQHARRIDPHATWQQIMDRARKQFTAVRRDMLAEYRRVTDELRSRILQEGVLELPAGEECKVISTPAFLRALLPTAAYTNPGPLDPKQIGVFFVSDPDLHLSPDVYCANVAQHYGIEETCVHEAYPGHHVQLCWANRAGSLTRQMADHIIFQEGWTLYCEQWMIDAGWFSDPSLKINYLVGQLWRAYRMIIDVGLHTRRMTIRQAIAMLMDGVGFTRERAVAELNWYSQSPGVPLSYMMGKRETLNLRDAFLKQPGSDLRQFHSWLLQFGSIPQRWLWEFLPS